MAIYYTEPILNRVVKAWITHRKPHISNDKNRCKVNAHGTGNTGISDSFCNYMDSANIIHYLSDIQPFTIGFQNSEA